MFRSLVLASFLTAAGGAAGAATATYWNLFNVEGESTAPAQFVTYGSLADMLLDANRLEVFTPGGFFARNIVGTGASIAAAPAPPPIPLPASGIMMLAGLAALAGLRLRGRP
jgi:hypothetical protein